MAQAIEVELNPLELDVVRMWARRVQRNKKKRKVASKKGATEMTEVEAMELGFAGEMAFAKIFNLYPNIYAGRGHREGDFQWKGKRVEVKTRPFGKIARLNVFQFTHVDFFALMHGSMTLRKFVFRGMIPAERIFHKEYNAILDGKPFWSILPEELSDPIQLL